MTRFVYLSDTHFGASGQGYHQQTPYPGNLSEIVAALRTWIIEDGRIDFVLHGGDMTDAGTAGQIREACRLFDLPVPVHLCLGNHDLGKMDSLKNWLEIGGRFFAGGKPEFLIETNDCAILVIPNQWGEVPYYWKGDSYPRPFFLPEQLEFFAGRCREAQAGARILMTHSPVLGLPGEQTGFPEAFHEPQGEFKAIVFEMLRRRSGFSCVLGAHNHLNMRVEHEGVNYITSSALVETPFECKLFEIRSDSLAMKTIPLASRLPFQTNYNQTRSFVQGRKVDRECVLNV